MAVYNGKTGELSLKKDVATGEIPGPVYPTSLSAYARKATRTADGFWSWITKAAGYAAYSSTKNSSELILQRADDSQTDYVTPLRLIGRGGGIVAVSETSASAVKAGQLNPTQIATLPKYRQGDAAVSDRIRTDYASLEWASGISVFEITPVDAKTWVATLGLRKSIKYRIHIKDDSSSCLYSVSNKLIRCTGDEESPNTEQPPAANPTSDLNTISDAELVELQEQVQREIRKRFLAKNK